jgi:hypothetical protein
MERFQHGKMRFCLKGLSQSENRQIRDKTKRTGVCQERVVAGFVMRFN